MRSSTPDPEAGRSALPEASGRGRTGWRDTLLGSVSPLAEGVGPLAVRGWHEPGGPVRPRRTAAVLVGVLDREQPAVVLTRRAGHLPRHAGQISFPGGAADQSDATGVNTALREAHEEIGLQPRKVQPIGFLHRIDTVSDYRILPVVGLVRQQPPFTPDPREVDEVFTLPLSVPLQAQSWERRELVHRGQPRMVYSLRWQGHDIWGATAAILLDLAQRMGGRVAL